MKYFILFSISYFISGLTGSLASEPTKVFLPKKKTGVNRSPAIDKESTRVAKEGEKGPIGSFGEEVKSDSKTSKGLGQQND